MKKDHKVENKDYMRAMQELRRSNASGKHTLKKFKKTRSESKRLAIRDSWN